MDNKVIRYIKQASGDEKVKVLDGVSIDWARVQRLEEWLHAEIMVQAVKDRRKELGLRQ